MISELVDLKKKGSLVERQLKAYLEIGFIHVCIPTRVQLCAHTPPPPYNVYKIVGESGVKVLRKL